MAPPPPSVPGPTPPGPPSPHRRLVIVIVVACVLVGVLLVGVVATALWLVDRRGGDEAIPDGSVRAEFRVTSVPAGQELSQEVREDVGRMLAGRLRQRGVPTVWYEVGRDRVEVGVSPEHESALADLREMSVTTAVELRLVTGEESTPGGCVPGPEVACSLDGRTGYRLGPVEIDGTALADARDEFDERTLGWTVLLTWTSAGQEQVERSTAEHVGEHLAITANGLVVFAPQIQQPIVGDTLQISGLADRLEAEHLAAELRLGRFPVSIIGDRADG